MRSKGFGHTALLTFANKIHVVNYCGFFYRFGVAASVSSFKVLAARPAVLNEHDYGITGCGVDGNVGGTRKMVVQYVYPAGPVNNSESKKEGSRTLNQIFSERSILVLPSVSDTNSKPPPLTSVTMNPQGTMTTSAIRVPISSTGTPHVPRKSYCGSRAVTQKLLQESDPKVAQTFGCGAVFNCCFRHRKRHSSLQSGIYLKFRFVTL